MKFSEIKANNLTWDGSGIGDDSPHEYEWQATNNIYYPVAKIIASDVFTNATVEAQDKFWEIIAKHYPNVRSGDFPPDATIEFDNAINKAVRTWLAFNSEEETIEEEDVLIMPEGKLFFYKDKSGRGFTNNDLSGENLMTWENEENWDGEGLHEWACEAEEGDEWENAATKIVCTKG